MSKAGLLDEDHSSGKDSPDLPDIDEVDRSKTSLEKTIDTIDDSITDIPLFGRMIDAAASSVQNLEEILNAKIDDIKERGAVESMKSSAVDAGTYITSGVGSIAGWLSGNADGASRNEDDSESAMSGSRPATPEEAIAEAKKRATILVDDVKKGLQSFGGWISNAVTTAEEDRGGKGEDKDGEAGNKML